MHPSMCRDGRFRQLEDLIECGKPIIPARYSYRSLPIQKQLRSQTQFRYRLVAKMTILPTGAADTAVTPLFRPPSGNLDIARRSAIRERMSWHGCPSSTDFDSA